MTKWNTLSRTAGLAVVALLPVRLAAMGAAHVLARFADRATMNAASALIEDHAHIRLVEAGLAGLSRTVPSGFTPAGPIVRAG